MIENDSVRENQKNRTHKLAFFCLLFTEQTCKGGLLDSASIPSQFEDAALPQETLSEADFVLKAQFLMTVEIKTEQRLFLYSVTPKVKPLVMGHSEATAMTEINKRDTCDYSNS